MALVADAFQAVETGTSKLRIYFQINKRGGKPSRKKICQLKKSCQDCFNFQKGENKEYIIHIFKNQVNLYFMECMVTTYFRRSYNDQNNLYGCDLTS